MMQATGTPRPPSSPRPGDPAQAPGSGPVIAPTAPQAPTEGVIVVPPPTPRPGSDDVPEGAMILGVTFFVVTGLVLVLFPIMRALGRRLDRAPAGKPDAALSRELAERLQRIEHAVDSISIEVERISEGQRFTTRLLSERAAPVPVERQVGSGA